MLQQISLMLCYFCFSSAPANAPDAIVDEIIAGCEANTALIDQGWARYNVTTTTADPSELGEPPRKKNEHPLMEGTQSVRIDFDRTRCRWMVGRIRCYRDDKHDVYFDARKLTEGQEQDVPLREAVHYRATINALHASRFSPTPYHPRFLGHGISGDGRENSDTIADVLRAVRKDPGVSIVATSEGKLLKVVLDFKSHFFRSAYWVSPSQGYSPVKGERWSLKASTTTPSREFQAEYKQVRGAFVASRYLQISRVLVNNKDDKYVESARTETVLTDIALGEQPKDELFSLKGLGMPRGTMIRDMTTGKEYLYEIKNVKEKDIHTSLSLITRGTDPDLTKSRVRSRTRNRIWIGLSVLLAALFLLLLWRRLRSKTV